MQQERGNAFVQQMVARRLGATDAAVARDRREGSDPNPGEAFRSSEADRSNGVLPNADEAIARASDSTAQPLPTAVRRKFEQSLGADLEGVRVHTGADSAAASQTISARAFTIGQDIHFAEGEYNPESGEGQHLLAHEVAHTVQQSSGGPSAQAKLEVSEPGDALELEADQVATAMVRGEAARVSPAGGVQRVARKKEDQSPFKGWAGEADARATEAGAEAGGFSPIKVSTDYAMSQVAIKDKQMEDFRHADIPFVDDNQSHPLYKQLLRLRQEYETDVTRISLAQEAFNAFVTPGSLANKSVVQLKQLQFELGFVDNYYPVEDLSKKEQLVLAKKLDEKTMNTLNHHVTDCELNVQGKRKTIIGTVYQIQAALQRRAVVLAEDKKETAQEDLNKINEKIQAVTEAAEAFEKVTEIVSTAGFAAPEALGMAGGGAAGAEEAGEALKAGSEVGERIKSGLELGGKGTSLVGSMVAFIMTQQYKEDIQKAKEEILKADVAAKKAKEMDAELSYEGATIQLQGQMDELASGMGELALALQARKDYFAQLGSDTDRATGNKPGGEVSPYLAYVSQAAETRSHLETAKDSASTARDVLDEQVSAMAKHRHEAYGGANAVWGGDAAYQRDSDGPDLEILKAALEGLEGFIKSSDDELTLIDDVVRSLPAPT